MIQGKNVNSNTINESIIPIKEKGRLKWQKETGYNRRSVVETAMFRYKTIFGDQLRSRSFKNQKTETRIGVAILKKNDKSWNACFSQSINQV